MDNIVYVILKTVTYHMDGESFSAEIEGVYADKNIAEETAEQIRKEWEEDYINYEDELDDEAPELEVEVIEQHIKL